MQKIAVTGGTGLIGQEFLRRYADQYKMVVLSSRNEFDGLFSHDNIEYAHSDYTLESLLSLFGGCSAVAHLGAKTPLKSKYERECVDRFIHNVYSSETVFDACLELGIKHIVSESSTATYGAMEPRAKETDATDPDIIYGLCKRFVEQLGNIYHNRYGLNIKSLRTVHVVGNGDNRGRTMMNEFWNNCLEGKPLTVVGPGDCYSEYIYVSDAADAIHCALSYPELHGEYNVGTGIGCTDLEVAEAFCEVFGNTAGIKFEGESKKKLNTILDPAYSEQVIGFRAKVLSMKEMVQLQKDSSDLSPRPMW